MYSLEREKKKKEKKFLFIPHTILFQYTKLYSYYIITNWRKIRKGKKRNCNTIKPLMPFTKDSPLTNKVFHPSWIFGQPFSKLWAFYFGLPLTIGPVILLLWVLTNRARIRLVTIFIQNIHFIFWSNKCLSLSLVDMDHLNPS